MHTQIDQNNHPHTEEPKQMATKASQVPQHVTAQPPTHTSHFKALFLHKKLLITLLCIFLLFTLLVGVLLFTSSRQNNSQDNTFKPAEMPGTNNNEQKFVAGQTTLTNNTFLKAPQKIEDLGLIAASSSLLADPQAVRTYYHIGTTEKGKRIVVYYVATTSPKNTSAHLFIEETREQYAYSEQLSTLRAGDVTEKVVMGSGVRLSELNFPSETTVADQKIRTTYSFAVFEPSGSMPSLSTIEPPKKVGDVSAYTLYRSLQKNEPNYQVIELQAVVANMFRVAYTLYGELSSTNQNLPITWSSGEQTPVKAYTGSSDCTSNGYVITNENKATFILVGKSKAGQNVFQLPVTSPLVKELYEKDYMPNQSLVIDEFKDMSVQTFTAKHAYFLVENGYGEYVVFKHADVFVKNGCTN